MKRWLVIVLATMGAGLGYAEDAWMIGRWKAQLPQGGERELVLEANGRFIETRASASTSSRDSSRSSASSASSRMGSWSLEDGTLTLQAGGEPSRRKIRPLDAPGVGAPRRMRLDDVVYERAAR